MDNSFDSLLNVSAVPQDDKVQAFIAESKNNRNRCYELSEQVTAQVATDGQMFQKYLDVQSIFDRYTANNALLILAQRPDAQRLGDGKSTGHSGNYSTNYQNTGRELMTPDEVRMLDNRYAILFIRGERPILDEKFDILKHPNVGLTTDGNGKPYLHGAVDRAVASISLGDCLEGEFTDDSLEAEDYELLSDEDLEEIIQKYA